MHAIEEYRNRVRELLGYAGPIPECDYRQVPRLVRMRAGLQGDGYKSPQATRRDIAVQLGIPLDAFMNGHGYRDDLMLDITDFLVRELTAEQIRQAAERKSKWLSSSS